MSLDYTAFETALRAFVVAATGIPASLVRMAHEKYSGGQYPANTPHATIMCGPAGQRGLDGYNTDTDLTRPAGQEVRQTTCGVCEMTVTIRCFGGTPDGNHSPLAILQKARMRLALPRVRDTLTSAGISPIGPGSAVYLPAIAGTQFEGRANLPIRCFVDASEEDFCGYIDWVTVKGTITNPDATITVDVHGSNVGVFGESAFGACVFGGP